jgi:hypothetical protein
VNQLIEEESSILTELSSRPDFIAYNNYKSAPSRDPLLPPAETKAAAARRQGLPSPSARPSPDPRGKANTLLSSSGQHSYKSVVTRQREKDVRTLQGLAGRDRILASHFQDSTVSDVSGYDTNSLPQV